MATARTHKLAFGKMEVSIASHTEKPDQTVELSIAGIEDAQKIAKQPKEGAILVDQRLIEQQYRDAVKLITDELGAVAKSHQCETNNFHPIAGVRISYRVPREKIRFAALRAGPEYKKAETPGTQKLFDALQAKLEQIAPEVESRLSAGREQQDAQGEAPPYLKAILEEPEDRKARLKKDMSLIAPEIAAHNIDTLVSYVENEIQAAVTARGRNSPN